MKEYIERSVLIERIKEELSFCEGQDPEKRPVLYGCELGLRGAMSYATTIPAADVVERKCGEWIWDSRFSDYTCSERHNWDLKTPNFCSNCGADMRSHHDSLCDQKEEES